MNRQITDFYNHLQNAVLTTNDFIGGVRYRKKDRLRAFAYCGLNAAYRQYLSLDLDYPGSARQFEVLHIPPPTIVVTNRANGHCHYLYRLRTPVAYHAQARKAPQAFFEAVQDELTIQIKADPAFNHYLVKNPLSDRWIVETFPTSYHLSDFAEYFDLPSVATAQAASSDQMRGRNDRLFHTLRRWAYVSARDFALEESWNAAALQKAESINAQFDEPLPWPEVRDTAKATAKWVWKRRFDFGNAREKKLTFTTEDAHQRMKAGAEYTNAIRVDKAKQQVLSGIRTALAHPGATLTPVLIARQTGLNIKTVRKYFAEMLAVARKAESHVGR